MVGFAPGGAADITARALSPKLAEALGQQFYIENRPGAGGMLGTDAAAKSPPDGYTLLLTPAADAVQPAVRRKLPYDLLRDFAAVARVVNGPWFLVVHPSVPARNAREFVALVRKNPGKQHAGRLRGIHPRRDRCKCEAGQGGRHPGSVAVRQDRKRRPAGR